MESGSNKDCGSSSTQYEIENIDDLDFDDLNGIPKDEDRTGLGFDDMDFDYDTDSHSYGGELVIDEGSLGENQNDNVELENDDEDCEIIGIKTPAPNSTLTSNNTNINTITLQHFNHLTTTNGVPNKKIIIIYKLNKNNSSSNVINSINMNINNDNGNHQRKQNINDGIVNPNLPQLPSLPQPKPKVPSQKHIDLMKKQTVEFNQRPSTVEELNDNDKVETKDQELPTTQTLDHQEERALQRDNLMENIGVKKVQCNQCFEIFYGPNSELILEDHILKHQYHNKFREFQSFADTFKRKRTELGYTQAGILQALGNIHGSHFSKSTISNFEALKLSFKRMYTIVPILRKWLEDVESAAASGTSTMRPDIIKKKRKERAYLEQHTYDTLEKVFRSNQKLTSEERTLLAENLGMDKEVLRVWFSNRRGREKRQRQRLNAESTNLKQGEPINSTSILGQTTSRPLILRTCLGPPPALIPIADFPFSTTARTAKVLTTSTCYTAQVPSSASTSATKVSSSTTTTTTTTTNNNDTISIHALTRPGPPKLYAITVTKPPTIKSPVKTKEEGPTGSPKDKQVQNTSIPNSSTSKAELPAQLRIQQLQVYTNKRKRPSSP